jgi:hypothetical protein
VRYLVRRCCNSGRHYPKKQANITHSKSPAKPVRLIDLTPREFQRYLEIRRELAQRWPPACE